MTSRIRRWVETDTGHRVPNHKSKCRSMHGHRYRWEVELEGDVVSHAGTSEEGMLMDFSDISAILEKYIHDVVDHAFIVYEGDTEAVDALSSIEGQKTLERQGNCSRCTKIMQQPNENGQPLREPVGSKKSKTEK